jgi:hypothetical protein
MAWPDFTADVMSRVLALLRKGSAEVDPPWLAPSVADALATCQTDFSSILANRAYGADQIDAWAAGPGAPHIVSTAFFLVCIDARADIRDENDVKVEPSAVLDRRLAWIGTKDTPALAVIDGSGNLIQPDNAATAGMIQHGNVTYNGPQGTGETFRATDGTFIPW